MALDPGFGYKILVTVVGVNGKCNAGHKVGDTFEVSVHNPSEMCGMFYHETFPTINMLQFGGNYPWFEGNFAMGKCIDPNNTVTVKFERFERI